MFPLMLNVTGLPVMLVGDNIADRVDTMREYGATDLHVFSSATLPGMSDFDRIKPRLVFIAALDDDIAGALRQLAHAVGAFVHVEDRIPLCDFHMPARIRRGHLQVTISTDGVAAGLSRVLRKHLETTMLGPEWTERVAELAAARRQWKADGLPMQEIARRLEDFIAARGWLESQ
jgi:precorrin-2 dehydrogenase/sirohydrochlorin ferrochelatase